MVCASFLRNTLIQAGRFRTFARSSWFGISVQVLHEHLGPYLCKCELRRFRASVKMMVDTGTTENRSYMVNTSPEKEDDSGYTCGGCRSEDGKLSCGYSSFRGKRASMEDFFDIKMSIINGNTVSLFGIFDGHGGSHAAEYLKRHLFENLLKHPQFMVDPKLAISETYKKTDMDFLEAEKDTFRDDGSTASTAILFGNRLYVANVGDSRTVVSKAGKAIPLSEDHKPNRLDERKRIESAGGVVMWAGTWRVGGVLAMSRAFGNRMLKQYVVAEPEIQEQEVNEDLELLVLASDGLWDVVPNEDAVSIAWAEEEPEAAARKLTETAFTRGSADNITCIVVKLNHDVAELDKPEHKGGVQHDRCEEVVLLQDQPREGEPQLDQSKEADHPEELTNELRPNLSKEPEILDDEREESMILEDENKKPDALSDQSKEPGLRQDHVHGLDNPRTEVEPQHDIGDSSAIMSA